MRIVINADREHVRRMVAHGLDKRGYVHTDELTDAADSVLDALDRMMVAKADVDRRPRLSRKASSAQRETVEKNIARGTVGPTRLRMLVDLRDRFPDGRAADHFESETGRKHGSVSGAFSEMEAQGLVARNYGKDKVETSSGGKAHIYEITRAGLLLLDEEGL